MGSAPDGVKLLDGRFYERRVIAEDTGLKVAVIVAFHAKAGAGEVGGTDVCQAEVKDDNLEMNSWAQDTLKAGCKKRVLVKVFLEVLAGFFCVD